MTLTIAFLIVALICFLLDSVHAKIGILNLDAMGKALWTAAALAWLWK